MSSSKITHLQQTAYRYCSSPKGVEARLYVEGTLQTPYLTLGLVSLSDSLLPRLPEESYPRAYFMHTVYMAEPDGQAALWLQFKEGTPDPLTPDLYNAVRTLAGPPESLSLTDIVPYPYQVKTHARLITETADARMQAFNASELDTKLAPTGNEHYYEKVRAIDLAAAALETVATLNAVHPEAMQAVELIRADAPVRHL